MHHRTEVVEAGKALREQGYRLTPQRLMVLDAVIAGEGHVTAETIHQAVAEEYPDVSVSTVYRTLETLRDLGLVTETDLGSGRVEYHFAEQAGHHHLVCRRCGDMAELPHEVFHPVEERLSRDYGFLAEMSHFAVFGVCARCAADGASPAPHDHHHAIERSSS